MARSVYLNEATVARSWGDAQLSLPDLIFATVRRALDRTGLEIDQVDSVVLASHDLVDGRSLSSMTTATAAGAYLKEEIRLSDDGAAAVALASAQVASGQAECCLVAAWGRASEGDPERISHTMFDPCFARPLGMTELAYSAMRASMALGRYPAYPAARERAAAMRMRSSAAAPCPARTAPRPLRAEDVAPYADVVAATVLTASPTEIEIVGVGMSSEPYWFGDRDLLASAALADASRRALTASGMTINDVDLFELDGLTLFDEALAVEAVGAAEPGCGMDALCDPRVNPSGGYALGHSNPAMGLVRTAEAARGLRDRAGGEPGGGVALASGSSTVCGQTQFAVVLQAR